jgi:hypothetical protein
MSGGKSQKSQKKKMVRVSAGPKATIATRTAAGGVIAEVAPTSPIFINNSDVQQAEGALVTLSTDLDARATKVKALELELDAERAGLANLLVDWDAGYDVFVSTARLYCATAEDAKALGLPAAGVASYLLVPPVAVLARWDARLGAILIRVQRAPGLRGLRIEVSPSPITATSFQALEGNGALATLHGYAPGTWWIRAASVRARARSEFTAPVAVIVK